MSQEAKQLASFLSDSSAEKRDILDYKAYRDALIAIINGLTAETSLTVAVYGEWGSGKTTLLKMVQDEIKAGGTQTIWVNVWQFGNEQDVWTAFLQSLLLKIKREMSFFTRLTFNLGLLRRRIDWEKVYKRIPEALARVVVVAVPLYFSLNYLNTSGGTEPGRVAAGAGTLVGTVLGWLLLLQPYLKAIRERVKVDLTGLVKSSELRERVSLLDQFKTYFEEMVTSLVGEKGRTVIFIDDLDRCPPDRIVQVLDAIKLFLDIPRCVYLIGLDREIVEQAIKVKFDKYKNPETEAREYLEKIIGLPFDLPPLSGEKMEDLVKGLNAELPDPQRSTKVFALGQEPNPRKVKRTINMFLLVWLLAQQREGLKDSIKPTRLAKIVVIQHSYRDLYVVLTIFPKYLGEIEAYFRALESHAAVAAAAPDANPDAAGEKPAEPAEPPQPPEHLKAFAGNENLRLLLTLHPNRDEGDADANFTVRDGDEYAPLPEEEVRAYIRLTRSISPEQKKVSSQKRTTPLPTPDQIFVNRKAELHLFLSVLEGHGLERILLVTGPGGIGKSKLLRRFGQLCEERKVPFAHARADVSEPYQLMEGIRRAFLMEEVRRAFVEGEFVEFDRQVASARSNDQLVFAYKEWLRRVSLKNKIVILIDNYDGATSAMRDWLASDFIPLVADLPNVILCIAGRAAPETPSLRRFTQLNEGLVRVLTLHPFSQADIADYISTLGMLTGEEAVGVLHKYSEGDPIRFMDVFLKYLESDQVL